MKTVPFEIIELDSEEGEQMPTSYHHTESPSTSQLCKVSSSSAVPAKSNYVTKSQKGMSSTSTFSLNSSTETSIASCKKKFKKAKVVEKTPRSTTVTKVPVKILPKPPQHEKLNVKIISCKSADIIDTTKESLSEEKFQKSKQKLLFLSPISHDPNNSISKILFKPDLPAKNSSLFKPVQQAASKLVCSKPSNQPQRQWEHILPVESDNNKINVLSGQSQKKIIREQRVYLTESRELMNKDNEVKNAKTMDGSSVGENIHVTDEEDPLYIPLLQRKIPSSLSIMKAWKGPFAHRNKAEREINLKTSKKLSHSNTPKFSPTQKNTNIKDMDIFTPIVTLTEPTNTEHSIVRNYTLLNKVTTKKKNSPVRSKRVPAKKAKKDSKRVADSDLIYRKKLVPGSIPVVISDRCRNFFVKNSAWDFLEPVFKGFNEREHNISQRCSDYFCRLSDYLKEYEHKQTQDILLTDDDLYYTRKIELLDKEGKLDKVYYVPPQVQNKRKKNPTYILPPTKKCKVVLQRDEHVENMLKTYLLREKLDSYLCHTLSIPKKDANKPLIILNKINFNVLKLNEILCQHSNIIYVKNVEDGFPEKLYKNDFIISKIESKTIRLVSPEALRHYFM